MRSFLEFETSDLETAPVQPTWATRVADVTVDTQTFLSSKCLLLGLTTMIGLTQEMPTLYPECKRQEKKPNLDGFMRSEHFHKPKLWTTNYKGSNPLCWMLWPHGFGDSFVTRRSDRWLCGKRMETGQWSKSHSSKNEDDRFKET